MKTIQIIIDDAMLAAIDRQCESRNRSAFFRQAADLLLKRLKLKQMEEKDMKGYKRHPVRPSEFSIWQAEQVWPE